MLNLASYALVLGCLHIAACQEGGGVRMPAELDSRHHQLCGTGTSCLGPVGILLQGLPVQLAPYDTITYRQTDRQADVLYEPKVTC